MEIEKPVPVIFEKKEGMWLGADLVVKTKIIVDTKNIDAIADIQIAQLLTYLRFLHLRHGLILNFKTVLMKKEIKRVLNGFGHQ